MENVIVKETWDLWKDNIGYLLAIADFDKSAEDIAEEILQYLEGEGAFTLKEDFYDKSRFYERC